MVLLKLGFDSHFLIFVWKKNFMEYALSHKPSKSAPLSGTLAPPPVGEFLALPLGIKDASPNVMVK